MDKAIDLTDRKRLFEEELPSWENYITKLASSLWYTKTIDRGLLGVEDIQNELRMALWQAIEKYDKGEGTKLSSWIELLLRQKCTLIMQAHYLKQPRAMNVKFESNLKYKEELDRGSIPQALREEFKENGIPLTENAAITTSRKHIWTVTDADRDQIYVIRRGKKVLTVTAPGEVQILIPLVGTLDVEGPGEEYLDVEDPEALKAFEGPCASEWFINCLRATFSVLENKKAIREKTALAMMLSGKYDSDREIAKKLDEVNFAKVGDVRLKTKLVFAILRGIPIDEFTRAANAKAVALRLRKLLCEFIEDVPPLVLTKQKQ